VKDLSYSPLTGTATIPANAAEEPATRTAVLDLSCPSLRANAAAAVIFRGIQPGTFSRSPGGNLNAVTALDVARSRRSAEEAFRIGQAEKAIDIMKRVSDPRPAASSG